MIRYLKSYLTMLDLRVSADRQEKRGVRRYCGDPGLGSDSHAFR